jgi:hypothetical protein
MFWIGTLVGLFVGVVLGIVLGGLLATAGQGEDLLAAALALEEKSKPSTWAGEPQNS